MLIHVVQLKDSCLCEKCEDLVIIWLGFIEAFTLHCKSGTFWEIFEASITPRWSLSNIGLYDYYDSGWDIII